MDNIFVLYVIVRKNGDWYFLLHNPDHKNHNKSKKDEKNCKIHTFDDNR